jgi:hypothetical protein
LISKLLFNLLNMSFPGRTTAVRRPSPRSLGSTRRFWRSGRAYHHKNHDNHRGNAEVMACARCRFQNSCCWRSMLCARLVALGWMSGELASLARCPQCLPEVATSYASLNRLPVSNYRTARAGKQNRRFACKCLELVVAAPHQDRVAAGRDAATLARGRAVVLSKLI